MAKEKTKAADLTPDLLPMSKKRGRPAKADAMTHAQRQAAYRQRQAAKVFVSREPSKWELEQARSAGYHSALRVEFEHGAASRDALSAALTSALHALRLASDFIDDVASGVVPAAELIKPIRVSIDRIEKSLAEAAVSRPRRVQRKPRG